MIAALLCLLSLTFCSAIDTQTVDPFVFISEAQPYTEIYMPTPAKMGVTGYIDVDLLFGADHWPDEQFYLGSRGYEYRFDLPAEYRDGSMAELHTTINAYSFSWNKGLTVEDIFYNDDPAHTARLDFQFGAYNIALKTKHIVDRDQVETILNKAMNIIVAELSK